MIDLLKLARQFGHGRLKEAIEAALDTGCTDAAAVQHLLQASTLTRPTCEPVEIGLLERYGRPLPVMSQYDHLLVMGGAQ